jgi:hypothetical protein
MRPHAKANRPTAAKNASSVDSRGDSAMGDKSKMTELPDAWARFERAVDVVAKSPPQHRTKSVPDKPKKEPKKPSRAKRA